MKLEKTQAETSFWLPLERGSVWVQEQAAERVRVTDSLGRIYVDCTIPEDRRVTFAARGGVGRHFVTALDQVGGCVGATHFTLRAQTGISCNRGSYAKLATRIAKLLQKNVEMPKLISGKLYNMFVCWGRDHVHTLKAMKYFEQDVASGLEYWLETQEANGMLWDCIYPNSNYPGASYFGEALGEGYYRYDEGMKYIVRRIPVEADCEFLYTEGVWAIWKATGDDAWMAKQLPVLERALTYNNSDPTRWSEKHRLVRRSMCQDSWDYAHPSYCKNGKGDPRCIYPGDPQFLFHGDNSGLYASYWRMAEMYKELGNSQRASELRSEGEALRARANAKLFFDFTYGHMIPEELPEEAVYAHVGDERERMSLSLGYTINRHLPNHEMAVKIIREYQRRYQEKKGESFAEWWTMDPPYTPSQWPGACLPGEYMNGAICTIIAGEIAKAAFDHGEEAYGADILERVWQLSERDGGELFEAYRRLPEHAEPEPASFQYVDFSGVANRGFANGAYPGLTAWTDEGDNDLRNMPVGLQRFGVISFDIVDPTKNGGRGVLFVKASPVEAPLYATIPVPALKGKSLYFLHATSGGTASVVGTYDIIYTDGVVERIFLRVGHEIGSWWGPSNEVVDRSSTRIAWIGPNPTWKHVGIYMYGWNNPRPDTAITVIRAVASPSPNPRAGIFIAGVSISDQPVKFEEQIRSYGLPGCWAQAAVFYAVAEGLAGIEDKGRAFDRVRVSPRWAASQATEAAVTLHYPASDGYCSYCYHDDGQGKITLDLTGSLECAEIHCLLPAGRKACHVKIDGKSISFQNLAVEASWYADFTLDVLPRELIVIDYGK